MTFLEAVVAINKREDLNLCEDPNELTGLHSCICVYQTWNGNAPEFIGKLRWPSIGRPAYVDNIVIWAIEHPGEDARLRNQK